MNETADPSQPDLNVIADAAEDPASAAPSPPSEPQAEDAQGVQQSPESVVEAILFATDTPLSAGKVAEISGCGTARDVKKHITQLNDLYSQRGASFRIEEIAGGFQMLTLPQYNRWLGSLFKFRQESKLSKAALETLAIVAYKQPVLRADVEAIRGVACGDIINRLRELNLVKIVGRADDVGRPILYGTTKKFLDVFGLASLGDLPKIEELTPPQ